MNTSALARALKSTRMSLAFARCYAAYRLWLRRERPRHAAGSVEAGDITIYYHDFGAGEPVRSIVLLGAPFHTDNYTREARHAIEGILRPYSPSMLGLRAMRRLFTAKPQRDGEFLEKMSGMWRELPDFTLEDPGRIVAPALVIGCDRDEFLSLGPDPLQVFKDTAVAIPNARLEVVRGGKHGVHMGRPRTVNRLIMDFIMPLAGGG